jgi:nucleoside-diphosphate-sugar epimerase
LYVQDCVDAILMAASSEQAYGEVLNVGDDTASSFLELAKVTIEEAGSGDWEFAPFTPERAAQEPGDFYSDISKIRRIVGWEPTTSLRAGVKQTVDYYRHNKPQYW